MKGDVYVMFKSLYKSSKIQKNIAEISTLIIFLSQTIILN